MGARDEHCACSMAFNGFKETFPPHTRAESMKGIQPVLLRGRESDFTSALIVLEINRLL